MLRATTRCVVLLGCLSWLVAVARIGAAFPPTPPPMNNSLQQKSFSSPRSERPVSQPMRFAQQRDDRRSRTPSTSSSNSTSPYSRPPQGTSPYSNPPYSNQTGSREEPNRFRSPEFKGPKPFTIPEFNAPGDERREDQQPQRDGEQRQTWRLFRRFRG